MLQYKNRDNMVVSFFYQGLKVLWYDHKYVYEEEKQLWNLLFIYSQYSHIACSNIDLNHCIMIKFSRTAKSEDSSKQIYLQVQYNLALEEVRIDDKKLPRAPSIDTKRQKTALSTL